MIRVHPKRCPHVKRLIPHKMAMAVDQDGVIEMRFPTAEEVDAAQIGCDVCCPREWGKSAFVRGICENMDIQIMEQLFTVET